METGSSTPKKGNFKLWKPSFKDNFQAFLTSPLFQCAAQLTLGMFVVCLFIFVRKMQFPGNCLAITLFIVCNLLVAQDNHVGSKLFGCSVVLGSVSLAGTVGGAVVSLCQQVTSTSGYTAFLMALAPCILPIFAYVRMSVNPPFIWTMGMICSLTFGAIIISVQFIHPVLSIWSLGVGYFIADAGIGAGVTMVMCCLVLPTFAGDEMMGCIAKTIHNAGKTSSRHASRLFPFSSLPIQSGSFSPKVTPDPMSPTLPTDEDGIMQLADEIAKSPSIPETLEDSDDGYLVILGLPHQARKLLTTSQLLHPDKKASKLTGGQILQEPPQLCSYRALVSRARALMPAAMMEPTFLLLRPFDPARWGRVIGATDNLITALAAMELLVEEQEFLINGFKSYDLFHMDVMEPFRNVYAKVAAACSVLSGKIRATTPAANGRLVDINWDEVREEVRASFFTGMSTYWDLVQEQQVKADKASRARQMRALMFTWVSTGAIIDAVEDLERAVAALIAPPPPSQGNAAVAWFMRNFGWAINLAKIMFALPVFIAIFQLFTEDLPGLVKPGGLKSAITNRRFQAGFKYWCVLVTVLLLIIGLSTNSETLSVKTYRPLYGYIASALAASERVEATVSKLTMWLGGTVVGATLGYVCMVSENLATSPYGLMAVICVYTFLVGCLSAHQFRLGIVYTLMAFAGIIVCQYNGVTTGTWQYYVARLLSICLGATTTFLIQNFIFPWYTSCWALETMGGTFVRSAKLLHDMYEQFYKESEAAALAADSAGAASAQRIEMQPVATKDESSLVVMVSSPNAPPAAPKPPPPGPPPPNPIAMVMAGSLAAVEISLKKDVVLWERGVMHTPKIVRHMLHLMYHLSDRMHALRLSLVAPRSHGTHSGWGFHHVIAPLSSHTRAVCECAQRLAVAVEHRLSDREHYDGNEVLKLLEELSHLRNDTRMSLLTIRQKYHEMVASGQERPTPENFSDIVRVFSMIFSLIKVFDQISQIGLLASGYDLKQAEVQRMGSWMK